MFLGTYHNRLHGKANEDTLVVEETYNLLMQKKKLQDGENVDIEKDNLIQICEIAKNVLLRDTTVLHIKPRLHIIGDLRGNYNAIWNLVSTNESTDKFLFLGDYVNNGKHSIELMTLILCMKILAPNQIFLLRGGNETPEMTKKYGFKEDCINRLNSEVYDKFLEVFECMPLAAIISNDEKTKSILLLNGGLSPDLSDINQIESIQRPIKNVDDGLVHEILFANPNPSQKGFTENKKTHNSYSYGVSAVHKFLKNNHLDQIVRSHQKDDFKYPFGDDHCVLSIYSANGMNLYIREDMLYTFSNRTNLNSFEEKLNNPVYPEKFVAENY